jgi:excisionase family DNA binding protein
MRNNDIYHDDEPAQNALEEEVRLMDENFSNVMNIDDLAEYLKLPKPTVYKLAQNGKIPGKKAGRQWRFHKEAIDRWLSEQDDVSPSGRSRD